MPSIPTSTLSTNEGLWRFSGMYGEAWDPGSGDLLMEVTEVSGNVVINRIDIPLVGRTKTGYKPGRETREGTLSVQKIDGSWEMEVWQFLSQSLEDRRAARDARSKAGLRPFTLLIGYDDPDALGPEQWQLDGVLLWQMPIGFNIADDLVGLQFPITWESERPITIFHETTDKSGEPIPVYYPGFGLPNLTK